MKFFFCLASFMCLFSSLFAQEQIKLCQTNTRFFTNCYTLSYTENGKGIFKQIHFSDDGKVFYGYGKFKFRRDAFKFKYTRKPLKNKVNYSFASENSTKIEISWENILGTQDHFILESVDSTGKTTVYTSSLKTKKVEVETAKVLQLELVLKEGENEIMRFKITNPTTNYVHISASNPAKTSHLKKGLTKLKHLEKDTFVFKNSEQQQILFEKKAL